MPPNDVSHMPPPQHQRQWQVRSQQKALLELLDIPGSSILYTDLRTVQCLFEVCRP